MFRMTAQNIAERSGDVRERYVRVFLPEADGTKSTMRRYIYVDGAHRTAVQLKATSKELPHALV